MSKKFNNHIFRKTKHLNFQNKFIFVDTESKVSHKDKDNEILSFYLGCAIFWDKQQDKQERQIFYKPIEFFKKIESKFTLKDTHQILYAHNTQHDLKQLNFFNILISHDWKVKSQYIKGKVFIFTFVKKSKLLKKNLYLHCWDTTNYFQTSLKEIGTMLNYKKLEINFDKCTDKELEIYCMRDSEICYKLIKKLIDFLETYDITKLKATAGSLSFNAYRHKFYNCTNKKIDLLNNIYIHDWKQAIKLERLSYKGGITDCFEVHNEIYNCYKTDVNSLYPFVMKDNFYPFRLLSWEHEAKHNQEYLFNSLFEIKQFNKKNRKYQKGSIAHILFTIPKKYAYLLTSYNNKMCFVYGNLIEGYFCQPELDFIEKYGKIEHIYQISIYLMRDLFSKFVNFFHEFKIKFEKENNEIFRQFVKLMLTNQYGKWGQKQSEYINLTDKQYKKLYLQYFDVIKLMLINYNTKNPNYKQEYIRYLGCIVNFAEIYVIDKQIYAFRKTNNNTKDSFVAIASFTTSYARMFLINQLIEIKRENCFYCDTDSLFINKHAYIKMKATNKINNYELGKWKIEGVGIGIFYNPKFYDFYDYKKQKWERKLKGVNQKTSIKKSENKFEVNYIIKQWEKYKTYMKQGSKSQIIHNLPKQISKQYTKGIVLKNNRVKPFYYNA